MLRHQFLRGLCVLGSTLLTAAVSACGSDSAEPNPAGTGGTGGALDAGQEAAPDAPDQDGPANDAPSAPGAPIWINAGHITIGTAQQVSFANVWNTRGAADERCVPHMIGPCLVVDCRDNLSGAMKGADLGEITITPEGKDPVVLAADADGHYTVSGAAPSFAEGDSLTFSIAGGADVDAFETQNLVVPAQPTMTSPVVANPLAEQIPVDRTLAFTVTWTGGAAKVGLNLQQYPPAGSADTGLAVVCVYDGAAGTGTVPAEIMSLFDTSSPSLQTVMAVTNGNGYEFTYSGTNISLWALNSPMYVLKVQ